MADFGTKIPECGSVFVETFVKYREIIENNTINKSNSQYLENELIKTNLQILPKELLFWGEIKAVIRSVLEERDYVSEMQRDLMARREFSTACPLDNKESLDARFYGGYMQFFFVSLLSLFSSTCPISLILLSRFSHYCFFFLCVIIYLFISNFFAFFYSFFIHSCTVYLFIYLFIYFFFAFLSFIYL